jgi:hypothetical protein
MGALRAPAVAATDDVVGLASDPAMTIEARAAAFDAAMFD